MRLRCNKGMDAMIRGDTYLDLISLTEDGAHISDTIMADLADVKEPARALAQIHKGTIWLDGLNDALGQVTNLHQAKLNQSEWRKTHSSGGSPVKATGKWARR